MQYQLILEKMMLEVHLGCSASEQAIPQMVAVDITLCSDQLQRSCLSDQLNDAICYATLTHDLQQACHEKRFNLIESLAYGLYQTLKRQLPSAIKIDLIVRKNPPLTNLKSCSFKISDC